MNKVEICECGNDLRNVLSFKMCGNCHHHQKDCICKGGLKDKSDHRSWRNACKCGREKYLNVEGDWVCPSCILNANDCPCKALQVGTVGGQERCPKSGQCPLCPNGKSTRCIQLPHPLNIKHECENGHHWGTHPSAYDEATAKTYRDFLQDIAQEQPQPHGEGLPVGERLIELIRERTKLGIEKYGEPLTTHNGRDPILDALQESIDLNQYLMQALMESEDQIIEVTQILHEAIDLNKDLMQRIEDQEAEIKRLSEEQIKPLADFLMQQSDEIGHPGDEGACAMAIRVIGELMDCN